MNTPIDHLAFLRETSLFAGVPDETLAHVVRIASEISHDAGRVVVRQGGGAHAIHVIIEGEVDVSADHVNIARLGTGDHFGEIAVVSDSKRNATVTAVTPVRLLAIDTVSFRRLAQADEALAKTLPLVIDGRLADRDEKLAD